ncbi:hypothetical protein [Streptomyces sp. NPDC088400]|uniref:hypothetical protein n=1 Tax=Streptomyces sp. NPDC088400 TaxID=3365861 RepID=UPI00381D7D26
MGADPGPGCRSLRIHSKRKFYGQDQERLETKERHFGRLAKKDDRDDGELDSKLVEESYHLDDLILQSRLAHCQLQKIKRFLLQRLRGTSLTKLVSAVGHK